jgi:hypothetical protein
LCVGFAALHLVLALDQCFLLVGVVSVRPRKVLCSAFFSLHLAFAQPEAEFSLRPNECQIKLNLRLNKAKQC